MGKILIACSGLKGMTYACCAMAHRLESAGYTIKLVAPVDLSIVAKEEKLEFCKMRAIQSSSSIFNNIDSRFEKCKLWIHHLLNRRKIKQQKLKELIPHEFINELKDFQPDFCLIDIELHEYILACYSRKIPFALLSQWFNTWPARGLPSLRTDIVPGIGSKGSDRAIQHEWNQRKKKRNWIFLKKKIKNIGLDRRSLLLSYADSVGFPSHYIKDNWWPGPYSYNHLPCLSMSMAELELPHVKPAFLTYIGPMVDSGRFQNVPDQLRIDVENARKSNKAIIVVTGTSMKLNGDKSIILEGGNKNWMIITNQRVQCPDAEIFFWEKLPMHYVLSHADLCIHHGGIHTIHECIYHGVPMLIKSGNKSDQNGCAVRMHYHELALVEDLDSNTISRRSILKCIDNQNIKANLEEAKNKMMRYELNKVLESYLADNISIGK